MLKYLCAIHIEEMDRTEIFTCDSCHGDGLWLKYLCVIHVMVLDRSETSLLFRWPALPHLLLPNWVAWEKLSHMGI